MLSKLGGISLQSDSISWLLTPKRFKDELLARIKAAKTSIIITALYLEDDEAGREILETLIDAKNRNPELDVKVLVDFHRARRGLIGQKGDSGNYLMYRELVNKSPHPISIMGVPVKAREFLGVLHLKGFIIDDAVIYSGASLNNIYLHQNEKYRFDRYHLIESPELAQCMRQFVNDVLVNDPAVTSLCQQEESEILPEKSVVRSFKRRLANSEYTFNKSFSGLRVRPLVGLGRKNNRLNKTILNIISHSTESLFFCTPYFNPPLALLRAITKYLKAGKKIDIVVGDKTANDFFIPEDQPFSTIGAVPYIYEQSLRKFLKRHQWAVDNGLLNIHLWKHDRNSFHLKGLSADNRYHLITGSNLNPRAWGLDLENGLLLIDEDGVCEQEFSDEQAHILEHTNRLFHYSQLETVHTYPAPVKKLMARISRLKADFLLKRIL